MFKQFEAINTMQKGMCCCHVRTEIWTRKTQLQN